MQAAGSKSCGTTSSNNFLLLVVKVVVAPILAVLAATTAVVVGSGNKRLAGQLDHHQRPDWTCWIFCTTAVALLILVDLLGLADGPLAGLLVGLAGLLVAKLDGLSFPTH